MPSPPGGVADYPYGDGPTGLTGENGMATARCPECDTVLTAAEAAAGTCPECATPLAGGLEAVAIPEALPVAPVRTRGRFVAGLVVGAVVALAGAAGWWVWGP